MSFQIPSYIPRPIYLNRVKPFIDTPMIKVLTGQRRVGKSYLLFQLMDLIRNRQPQSQIIYINKEDLAFSYIKTAKHLDAYVKSKVSTTQKNYLFIDEIQEIEEFPLALRSFMLNPNMDVYCTGSNAHLLSADVAGQLSGRSIEIPVYSLTYQEFLEFHNREESHDTLELYLKYGGLPYLKHLPLTDEVVFEYLKNIYSTIIFRDVVNRYAVRNTPFLEQLTLFLASNTGSLFSAKSISDFLKSQRVNIAPNQVQVYIQHLANAFLIHPVRRFDVEGRRLFEFGEKYYFENLGIRNALWGYRLPDLGKIMENAVHNHLRAMGYKLTVGTIGNYEVDFVAEKEGERLYVQVALSLKEEKTVEREFGNLLRIKDNYPKMVVTSQSFAGNSVEGIPAVGLQEFLTCLPDYLR